MKFPIPVFWRRRRQARPLVRHRRCRRNQEAREQFPGNMRHCFWAGTFGGDLCKQSAFFVETALLYERGTTWRTTFVSRKKGTPPHRTQYLQWGLQSNKNGRPSSEWVSLTFSPPRPPFPLLFRTLGGGETTRHDLMDVVMYHMFCVVFPPRFRSRQWEEVIGNACFLSRCGSCGRFPV